MTFMEARDTIDTCFNKLVLAGNSGILRSTLTVAERDAMEYLVACDVAILGMATGGHLVFKRATR